MKYGIIGSRSFLDYDYVCSVLDPQLQFITKIVSGGAVGADSLGAMYAADNNIELTVYLPDWKKYGKSAGFRRNKDIVRDSDIIIAFWDGISNGTKHSLDYAKSIGVKSLVHIIKELPDGKQQDSIRPFGYS